MRENESLGEFPLIEPEASDRVWMASSPSPDFPDDDDFHGCGDCNDPADRAVRYAFADPAENGGLVDGKRVLSSNPSVQDLLEVRREAVRRE